MPEVPSSPHSDKEPIVEPRKDDAGNLWFAFNRTPLKETVLHGQRHTTAMITPEGMTLLNTEGVDRRAVLERVAQNRLTTGFGNVGSGAEGVVREVSSAKSQFERLFSSDHVTALRKDILPDRFGFGGREKALGWEVAELFDVIRPAFDAHGFQLMHLYGANDTQLFMPKLVGKKLHAREIEIQTKGKEVGVAISDMLEGQTIPLYQDSLALLTAHMEKLGFHRDPAWKFEDYLAASTSPSFLDEAEKSRVEINIDFATTQNYKQRNSTLLGQGNVPSNFDSWIVQDPKVVETVLTSGQNGNIEEAVAVLKKEAVCYDPLFVTKTYRQYETPR